MYIKRNAFTMIELIFVIVVLGILAAVAVPRLAATRDDAHIAKARSDVSSIRSAIVSERQSRLFRGQTAFISALSTSATTLFDGNGTSTLLSYGITAGTADGDWSRTSAVPEQYTFYLNNGSNTAVFDYNASTGIFDCAGGAGTLCASLTD